jgi:hemolysin III
VSPSIPHLSPEGAGPLPADHSAAYARFKADERANQLTHGLGLALSLAGAGFLCRHVCLHGDAWQITGCLVFSAALVAVYAASTLSHSFETIRLRHFFRTLDQVCIFLLIAGTYTPFGLKYLRTPGAMALLVAIWILAVAGIVSKLFVTRVKNVATAFYVLLGWLPILAIKSILEHVPGQVLGLALAGGFFYTVGTYFLTHDNRRLYFHAWWHVLVMAGSACHYLAVLLFVADWRP